MALLGNSNIGVGRKNYIINGDFRLWQRGIDTGVVPTTTTKYMPDRFCIIHVSDGALRLAQSQSFPTPAESGHLFTDSAYVLVPTADATIGSSQHASLRYMVEGYDFRHLIANQFITLSFWVRSNVTGIYCVVFRNNGFDRCYIKEYTINSINTWEKKILTIPMNFTGGSWNYTNGTGLAIFWMLACGSSFYGTKDIWNSSNVLASSNQVNFMSSTSNEFRINGVQLECGPIATDFEMRHIAEELTLAQRYYEKSYALTTAPGTVSNDGRNIQTTAIANDYFTVRYCVRKRNTGGAVIVTPYSYTDGASGVYRNASANSNQTPSGTNSFESSFELVSVAAINQICGFHWTSDSEL